MKSKKFTQLKLHTPSLHLTSGQTGGGKTVLDFSLADMIHKKTGKHIFIVLKETDRPVETYENIPEWIHTLNAGEEHPVDSIIVGDDWQRVAPARRAMSNVNVLVDELMGLLRHNDIDYVIDVQTFASLDRNSVIRCDYLWFKKPYQKEVEFSRPELKAETETAAQALKDQPITTAYLKSVDREDFEGMVTDIPLPKYWSEELSTLHRTMTEEERVKYRGTVWEKVKAWWI